MRRDRGAKAGPSERRFDPESLRRHFDRPEVAAAYLFGSMAQGSPHGLSDVDLAYLGTNGAAEERAFDDLYEALQRELGEGLFDPFDQSSRRGARPSVCPRPTDTPPGTRHPRMGRRPRRVRGGWRRRVAI